MQLNERKIKILEAIINDYIQTAEPIGSRTIAKKYDWGISPATIRNEMSDLEDMGLILQTHASSGRVPSDKGYRLYVDSMMKKRSLTNDETLFLQRMIQENINQIDLMMQETAKAVSFLTKYTTIVTEPYIKKTKINHIHLAPLDEKSILLVLVTDAKAVKNHVIYVSQPPDYEELINLSRILYQELHNRTIQELDQAAVERLYKSFGRHTHVLMPVLKVIVDVIRAEDDVQIYTSGVRNILAFPEFADINKAKAIFHALEEREMLITIMGRDPSDRIQIIIGSENDIELLKICTLIKANYMMGNQNAGCIGIIGPTRMNYGQVVSVLEGILVNICAVTRAISGG